MPKGVYIRKKRLDESASTFPQETARAAVTASVHIVTAGLKALAKSITHGKPSDIAKNMKFCMDMADKLLRAAEFAAGKPDSRPDTGLDALFAKLTTEQALELKAWLAPKDGTAGKPGVKQWVTGEILTVGPRNGDWKENSAMILPTTSSSTAKFS